MSGSLSDKVIHDLLSSIRERCFVSLHFDSPWLAGAYASEISGGGYSRARCYFTDPSARTIWNTSNLRFSGLPQTRITHIGGWNEQTNGDLLWAAEIDLVNVINGGGYSLPASDIAISFG